LQKQGQPFLCYFLTIKISHMKNLTLLLLVFFLYGNALMAQPSEGIYKARCSELDKSKIKTDFLADYRHPINNIY